MTTSAAPKRLRTTGVAAGAFIVVLAGAWHYQSNSECGSGDADPVAVVQSLIDEVDEENFGSSCRYAAGSVSDIDLGYLRDAVNEVDISLREETGTEDQQRSVVVTDPNGQVLATLNTTGAERGAIVDRVVVGWSGTGAAPSR